MTVDVWLDPMCPWSGVTAEWVLEVQREIGLDVRWHAMSLAILNEGQEIPEEWRQLFADSWGPVRVLAAADQRSTPTEVGQLVSALVRRFHADGRRDVDAVIRESVQECGMDSALAELAWLTDLDEDLRANHSRAMALGGTDVGSPIIALPGPDGELVGFYGPVIAEIPRGDAAVRLWEAFLLLAATPGFFEIKRTRDVEPSFG
ncbi:MAG: disulfide bond formation protein DsbA [Actinobacteria bacterium]|nr:disulfide bond formation protein DsbA [Actinomycetota bacterium]